MDNQSDGGREIGSASSRRSICSDTSYTSFTSSTSTAMTMTSSLSHETVAGGLATTGVAAIVPLQSFTQQHLHANSNINVANSISDKSYNNITARGNIICIFTYSDLFLLFFYL